MAYMHRPHGSSTYIESEREVIRDSYSSEYPMGPRRHHNGVGEVVGEVVGAIVDKIIPGSHGHHHNHLGGSTEIIERREERIYENDCEPCRRVY